MGHWGAGSVTSQIWRPHRVLWRTHKAPRAKKNPLRASQLNQKGATRREESCADVTLRSRPDVTRALRASGNPNSPLKSACVYLDAMPECGLIQWEME